MRDLGGLRTTDGGETRWGAVVRCGSPDGVTPAGWAALHAYGIRTIVDLRNDDERASEPGARPTGIEHLHLPLDGIEDAEFWREWTSGPQFATPLYYRAHLDHFPKRNADVVAAIGRAAPGGVLVHCVGGRDRAGQIAMLLLALAGVEPEQIAADYCRSGRNEGDELLAREGTSAGEVIVSTLAELDVEACLRAGGAAERDLAAVRARLLA